ncbi:MAG: J domain-containing protein [Treponema sp.]|nr:J domain-containing protein [Treponema sp.]
MTSLDFKKDLTKLTSLIASRKSEEEIKKSYIELSKKYHPDTNGKSEEEKLFCTECMRIINQVYDRFEKGDVPKPVVQNNKKGPFKYVTYFGEEKSFDDYNEFLFNYGKYCYYAAKSFYDMDDKMKDALTYFDDCIKAFEKWSTKNQPLERIELAKHFLQMARIYKATVDGRLQRLMKEMKDSPWGQQYMKNEGID